MIVRTAIVIAERSNVCVTQDISVPIVLKTHVKPQEPTAGLMVNVCPSTWEGPYRFTQEACVCDAGWSGPTCEENPCAGKTCSGHGTCQA